jgi:hypothetical protein
MNPVVLNPMGFYCAPNGTDPCYASEHDFERFIAFGMLQCVSNLSEQGFSDHALVDDEHRRELREAFLAVVEGTLQFFWTGDFEIGQENFDSDMFGDGCEVNIGNSEENPGENETMWSWSPFAIHEDCIIFDLWCMVLNGPGNDGDPTTLFLSMEAIQDRQLVRDVIRKAREINGCPYRTDYQDTENDKLWEKVLQPT